MNYRLYNLQTLLWQWSQYILFRKGSQFSGYRPGNNNIPKQSEADSWMIAHGEWIKC